jgi:hypothetical protein
MSNLNYRLILSESIKSLNKNPITYYLSSLIIAIPLAIAYITNATKNSNIGYLVATVPLLLILIGVYYYLVMVALKGYLNRTTLGSLKFSIVAFSNFVITSMISGILLVLSALPAILALIVFGFAFYNVILPYNKINFSFNDLRLAISSINTYFYTAIALTLLNLPLISYVWYKVGLAPFYSVAKNLTTTEALKENAEDSKTLDYVDGFYCFLMVVLFDLIIVTIVSLLANHVLYSTLGNNIWWLTILIPFFLLPIQAFQLSTIYNKISKKDLLS